MVEEKGHAMWFWKSLILSGAAGCIGAGLLVILFPKVFAWLAAGLLFTCGTLLLMLAWKLWRATAPLQRVPVRVINIEFADPWRN